ncbi:MAG TPA: hypothetical protein VHS58_16875 [Acetobacteraceae bacterium]|jgi:hypothetical protein|nr:hypothetical protein [Acetobacteraceae bacterium]
MPERARPEFVIQAALGNTADPADLLAQGFVVACVEPNAAVCARLRGAYKDAIAQSMLRVVHRTPAAASAPRTGRESRGRSIDWQDLQLMLGTPYYLRVGGSAASPFVASMAATASHPDMITVGCRDPVPLTVLDSLGYRAVLLTEALLPPEFAADPKPPARWTSFAEARARYAADAAAKRTAGLVCHARR